MHIQPKFSRTFIGRFEFNDDLLATLTDFCRHKNIRTGIFQLIGAVQNAKLGFYDQKKKKYAGCTEINKKLEIASCSGNISLNHGEILCTPILCSPI
jgi:predicted DNA-binding protein with PD1-like motif